MLSIALSRVDPSCSAVYASSHNVSSCSCTPIGLTFNSNSLFSALQPSIETGCSLPPGRIKTLEYGAHLLGVHFFLPEFEILFISQYISLVSVLVLLIEFHTLNVILGHYSHDLSIVLQYRQSWKLFMILQKCSEIVSLVNKCVSTFP